MARKIILLSDGTGNSAAKVWRTNVWRVFESLDLKDSSQVAFYDDGVGTASFLPLAILGGAFGYGLKRNVIDIYKFACRNYCDSTDEIFGFGFSRGAFTIRVVIGLIADQGLVIANSEAELNRKAKAAYRAYRARKYHTKWWRPFREKLAKIFNSGRTKGYDSSQNIANPTIRFLGLWDTVAAYGLPIEEMTRGFSDWIWPLMLPDCKIASIVKRACHALSIDDERTTFHPVLMDERDEVAIQLTPDGSEFDVAEERISQVWFSGVHSNVGGGYPDDSVAHLALTWIMDEAKKAGISFKHTAEASPQTILHPLTVQDKDGRIYDSRSGLGGYYRYGPRDIQLAGKSLLVRESVSTLPRIHVSVLKRIQTAAHAYAPVGLPPAYTLLEDDGHLRPLTSKTYETPASAEARWQAQQIVWNTVWWRRIVYFLTVLTTLSLFSYPIMRARTADYEFTSHIRWVSDIVRLAQSFLPSAVKPWADGYARNPGLLLILIFALIVLLKVGGRLASSIRDQMHRSWQQSLKHVLTQSDPRKSALYKFRTSKIYVCSHYTVKRVIAPIFFALMFIYFGVVATNRAAFIFFDDLGLVCDESSKSQVVALAPGESLVSIRSVTQTIETPHNFPPESNMATFVTSSLCHSTKLIVEAGGEYKITLTNTGSFQDWGGAIKSPFGYYSFDNIRIPPKSEEPDNVDYNNIARQLNPEITHIGFLNWRWVRAFLLVPFRREITRPWFYVFARYGTVGGEEEVLVPDFTESKYILNTKLTPKRSGELFLFVNDAVLGIPGFFGIFYKDNLGSAPLYIQRTR